MQYHFRVFFSKRHPYTSSHASSATLARRTLAALYCVKEFCESANAKNATSNGIPERDPILYMSVGIFGNPSGTATTLLGTNGTSTSISVTEGVGSTLA